MRAQEQQSWYEAYSIPWEKLPKDFLQSCERKEKLTSKVRRKMISALMIDIEKKCENPKRAALRCIAEKIVRRYPDSFKVVLDGEVVSDGINSLMLQMESKKDNELRGKASKRSYEDKNTYGCIKSMYMPEFLEGSEQEDSLEAKRQMLHDEFQKTDYDKKTVDQLMEETYAMQRHDILAMKEEDETADWLLDRWPFLAEEKYFLQHYTKLTGKDPTTSFVQTFAAKSKLIYTFLRAHRKGLSQQVQAVMDQIKDKKNEKAISKGLVHLIAAYFKEEGSDLVRCFDVSINLSYRVHFNYIWAIYIL